jgi:hypothetical protein
LETGRVGEGETWGRGDLGRSVESRAVSYASWFSDSIEEAREMALDAIEIYLRSMEKHGKK